MIVLSLFLSQRVIPNIQIQINTLTIDDRIVATQLDHPSFIDKKTTTGIIGAVINTRKVGINNSLRNILTDIHKSILATYIIEHEYNIDIIIITKYGS